MFAPAVVSSLVGLLAAGGGPMTLASAPPVVVKAVPESGSGDVDPNSREIRVTFSKDMKAGWSWNKTPDAAFPKTTGEPRFEKDQRTCVLPVSLEPGKTYALWLNSVKGGNFRDAGGQLAVPYLLIFKTHER
jgi:RNA polymerase sigma-70 factor (ECF subfamily)